MLRLRACSVRSESFYSHPYPPHNTPVIHADALPETDSPVPKPQVEVSFFKNGEFQGVAFADAPAAGAEYFPAVSLYTHATQSAPAQIRVNFGAQPFAIPGGVAATAAAAGVPLCRPVRDVLLAAERPIKSDPGDGVAINLEASAL